MLIPKTLDCRPDTFIGAYILDRPSVCDDLIALFKTRPDLHVRGAVNTLAGERAVVTDFKHSEEMLFPPGCVIPEFAAYLQELQKCLELYIRAYPFCDAYAPWTILEGTNVQYYPPGGGYKVWHTERNNATGLTAARHLVFMTYLNDVTDAGQTEFYFQKLLVRPERGLTLIWPADWTHTHRGIVSPTQDKYIITGWLNFTA